MSLIEERHELEHKQVELTVWKPTAKEHVPAITANQKQGTWPVKKQSKS